MGIKRRYYFSQRRTVSPPSSLGVERRKDCKRSKTEYCERSETGERSEHCQLRAKRHCQLAHKVRILVSAERSKERTLNTASKARLATAGSTIVYKSFSHCNVLIFRSSSSKLIPIK